MTNATTAIDRAAASKRILDEAKRIVRKNRKDLGHLMRERWRHFELNVRFRRENYTTGHANGAWRVVLTVSPSTPWGELVWLLTHELAHLIPGSTVTPAGGGRRNVHGGPWQAGFCRISEAAHGVNCWPEWTLKRVWSRSAGVDGVLLTDLLQRHPTPLNASEPQSGGLAFTTMNAALAHVEAN